MRITLTSATHTGGRPVQCSALSIRLGLGSEAHWALIPDADCEHLYGDCIALAVEHEGEVYEVESLKLHSVRQDWLVLDRFVAASPPQALWTFCQRGELSIAQWANGCAAPWKMADVSGLHIDAKALEALITPELVLAIAPGVSGGHATSAIDALLRERGAQAVGVFDRAQPDADWEWAGAALGNDPNWLCTLAPARWKPARNAKQRRVWRNDEFRAVVRHWNLGGQQQLRWLKERLGTHFDLASDDRVPLRPMSATHVPGEQTYIEYCILTLRAGEVQEQSDTTLELQFADTPATRLARPFACHRVCVLARFQGWTDQDCIVALVPPAENDPLPLAGFPMWQLQSSDVLLAALLTPGFSREHHSAFSAGFAPGDWVVVQLETGATPLVLGAIQRKRAEVADGQVALRGLRVAIVSVDEQGAPTGMDLVVDAAAVGIATEVLKISGDEILSAQPARFAAAIVAEADSQFQGAAKFTANVEVN